MNWKTVAIAFAVSFASVSSANAGLFEFLFGRKPAAPVAAPVADHPTVTISKPRKTHVARRSRPQPVVDPKAMLAATIDPVANPDWYLMDPTLRRGDILVLTDRVLVFNGGEIGASKSYAALQDTKLLGAKDKLMILAMTGGPREPQLLADGAGPRQPRLLKSASLVRPLELRSGL